jgi:hypothetical protein
LSNKNILLLIFSALLLSSCSKEGYGVLLWTTEDPPILSGTVLPVYIKSNINQVYVVGVPGSSAKIEVPLTQFEFIGGKRKARKWASEFFKFASTYAENLQDGLPVREAADNSAKRAYRLRQGEVIKILDEANGQPPISTTGDPLPGKWYRVLTQEGVTGYCFSYRLKIFDSSERSIQASYTDLKNAEPDPDLDMVLSKKWSPESYMQMVNSRRININELEKNYHFDPGQDSGIAKIVLPDLEKEFFYQSIVPDGEKAWIFEGAGLQMHLRSNNTLAVQYDNAGNVRTILFVALTADVEDLIVQENTRRENQYKTIYNQGPVFTSSNYGTISFAENGTFTWTSYELLVPQLISSQTSGTGRVQMDIFISTSLAERYTGAFTLHFTDINYNNLARFMYIIDNNGMRLEAVPEYTIEDVTVTRRDSSPMVLYFFRDSPL